jgi:hypothetical protein
MRPPLREDEEEGRKEEEEKWGNQGEISTLLSLEKFVKPSFRDDIAIADCAESDCGPIHAVEIGETLL